MAILNRTKFTFQWFKQYSKFVTLGMVGLQYYKRLQAIGPTRRDSTSILSKDSTNSKGNVSQYCPEIVGQQYCCKDNRDPMPKGTGTNATMRVTGPWYYSVFQRLQANGLTTRNKGQGYYCKDNSQWVLPIPKGSGTSNPMWRIGMTINITYVCVWITYWHKQMKSYKKVQQPELPQIPPIKTRV